MAWRIEIDKDVQRSMKKLDKQIAKRIVAKLHEISQLEDPRSMGKGLTENKSGLWRYRVGDYRIVADIEDDWWVEVDSGGNELPGDWEYDPESGCVYCSVG